MVSNVIVTAVPAPAADDTSNRRRVQAGGVTGQQDREFR